MKFLINYLRQAFCKHSFQSEDKICEAEYKRGVKTSLYCLKCGYQRSYWKLL